MYTRDTLRIVKRRRTGDYVVEYKSYSMGWAPLMNGYFQTIKEAQDYVEDLVDPIVIQ